MGRKFEDKIAKRSKQQKKNMQSYPILLVIKKCKTKVPIWNHQYVENETGRKDQM